jgi:Raf kinase inhibitor-like YbhB/YbcL family protein
MQYLFFFFLSAIVYPAVTVRSPAFTNRGYIPFKYTCEGSNINPPLEIGNIPAKAKSLAIIVDDPDAPGGTVDHWLMWNIPVKGKIEEDSSPGLEGKNVNKENKYTGPCPPAGTHAYHFKVYVLDENLLLAKGANKKSLEKAMEGHTLAFGELIGLYKKIQNNVN